MPQQNQHTPRQTSVLKSLQTIYIEMEAFRNKRLGINKKDISWDGHQIVHDLIIPWFICQKWLVDALQDVAKFTDEHVYGTIKNMKEKMQKEKGKFIIDLSSRLIMLPPDLCVKSVFAVAAIYWFIASGLLSAVCTLATKACEATKQALNAQAKWRTSGAQQSSPSAPH